MVGMRSKVFLNFRREFLGKIGSPAHGDETMAHRSVDRVFFGLIL
jgi:hypothetical protein